MGCLRESPEAIRNQHAIFFLLPQNQGCYPNPGQTLTLALPVWKVRSLIKEGWASVPQGWTFCYEADYRVTQMSDLRKLYSSIGSKG